jgi:hypothetical protein
VNMLSKQLARGGPPALGLSKGLTTPCHINLNVMKCLIWMVAVNMLSKQLQQLARGGPPALGLSKGLTTPCRMNLNVMKCFTRPWTCPLKRRLRCRLEDKINMDLQAV